MNEIVWLTEERTFAQLINLGAHYSIVRYTHGHIDYEVLISNDEFKYVEGEGSGDTEN